MIFNQRFAPYFSNRDKIIIAIPVSINTANPRIAPWDIVSADLCAEGSKNKVKTSA